MTTVSPTRTPESAPPPEPPASLVGRGRGRLADRGFRGLTLLAGVAVVGILGGILASTANRGWPAFRASGWHYLTGENFDLVNHTYGALSYIYGTLVVSAISLVFAVPVSVGIALFVTELAPRPTRFWITTVMDLLAAVPSVVFGLWGFFILRVKLNGIYNSIHDHVKSIPVLKTVFGPSASGLNYMTAGLIVALMITPIITSITREVFNTVPRNDKDGALALGATRWEMIRGVVLPHSTGGIVGAVMLGLGRAMGETIAIALVLGGDPHVSHNLFAAGEALPSVIVKNLPEATGNDQSALIGLGVVLIVLTLIVNLAARLLVNRIDARLQGA